MKHQLIVKETGKSINLGDIITFKIDIDEPNLKITGTKTCTLTEKLARRLLAKGILTVQTFGKEQPKLPDLEELTYSTISKTFGKTPSAHEFNTFVGIFSKFPFAFFSIVLRELAIELDKQHPGDISDSKELWCISLLNGKVAPVNRSAVKNLRNFAAFRTKEDAEAARTILKPLLDRMFCVRK